MFQGLDGSGRSNCFARWRAVPGRLHRRADAARDRRRETARRIRMADPDINIVIVSGYSDHSVVISPLSPVPRTRSSISPAFVPEEVAPYGPHARRALGS